MSVSITLQADLTVTCNRPGGPRITIPSGTVLTFPDAIATTFTGYQNFGGTLANRRFATALCAAADMLKEIGGRAALQVNETEFDNQTVDGVTYFVTFGTDGQAVFQSAGVSTSASPSVSLSASPSASPSASTSSSRSASPSASSDARLKENIVPVDNALARMAQVRGVAFNWKDSGKRDMGVIAQEVQHVFPELVSVHEEGHLQVNYNGLVGVLFAAVQELSAQLQELRPEKARAAGGK